MAKLNGLSYRVHLLILVLGVDVLNVGDDVIFEKGSQSLVLAAK